METFTTNDLVTVCHVPLCKIKPMPLKEKAGEKKEIPCIAFRKEHHSKQSSSPPDTKMMFRQHLYWT